VAGWAALAERYGRLGFDAWLTDAIDAAERGFALGFHSSRLWSEADHGPDAWMPAPRPGARVEFPELGATMRSLAEHGPRTFYEGRLAEAIAGSSWLSEEDLAEYEPRWVEPLALDFDGVRVLELPAPTQGVAALEA